MMPAVDAGSPGVRRDAFGLERTGLVGTVAVIVIILVYVAGLPLVDAVIPPDASTFAAGHSVSLSASPGSPAAVRFSPASDWRVHEAEPRPDRRTLGLDAVTMTVEAGPGTRPATTVLDANEDDLRNAHSAVVLEPRATVETTQGVTGVGASFVTDRLEGLTFAFSHRGAIASVVVEGPSGSLRGEIADDVLEMVRTIRFG
jgi:hypothetical protein